MHAYRDMSWISPPRWHFIGGSEGGGRRRCLSYSATSGNLNIFGTHVPLVQVSISAVDFPLGDTNDTTRCVSQLRAISGHGEQLTSA